MSTLKRFFISFLGALAGIWFSVLIGGVIFVLCIGALVAAGLSNSPEVKVEKHSILHLKLSGEITDRVTHPKIFDQLYGELGDSWALNDMVRALELAAKDDRVDGVFIDGSDAAIGMANAQELITAIQKFRKSGKWVIAYADNYTQGNYFIASQADSIFLNPAGSVDIHGLATQIPYFKGLLDRLGVEMQVVKVGTYKSAVEPYLLNEASEANREQYSLFLNQLWDCMRTSIADARGIKGAEIDKAANEFIFAEGAQACVDRKFVDGLRYRHQVEQQLCALTDREKVGDLRYVTPDKYCADGNLPSSKTRMSVAVLYLVGDIVDSGSEGIVGNKMSREILDIAEDDDIDALIMRVNSGGGSAFASEQIWEAVEQYKELTGKPVYVSMADYAASGGYYISCGANRIYAEPTTLTGSIGIFGMIPNIQKGMREHLGVNMEVIETGPNGAFPTLFRPMTESQRASMQRYVEMGYNLFTSRVAKGRNIPVDSVKAIGEGRVWDGRTALKIGLVDRLGGLEMAIADMAAELDVSPESLEVVEYPDPERKWWHEVLEMSRMSLSAWILGEEIDHDALQLYRATTALKQMNPVQARMPMLEVR